MLKRLLLITAGFLSMNNYASFFKNVQTNLEEIETKGIIHSFIAYIQDGKESSIRSFGHENLSSTDDFEIGSLTKGITGLIVRDAISEKKFKLNSKVSDFFNKSKITHQNITIQELLTHTSGLTNKVGGSFSLNNPYSNFDKNKLIEVINSSNLGEKKFNYSNFGPALLGLILEKVYNKDYCEILKEFTYKHKIQGMEINPNLKNLVQGYSSWFNKVDPFDIKSINPSGGIKANLKELMALSDKFISGEFKEAQTTLLDLNSFTIGYLWGQLNNNTILTHTGTLSGHSSFFMVDTKNKRSLIVLANTRYDLSFMNSIIFDENTVNIPDQSFIKKLYINLTN